MNHNLRRRIAAILVAVVGLVVLAEACAPALTFRAYLSPDFFQPFRRFIASLAKPLPAEKRNYLPYSGIAGSVDGSPMSNLREAYETLLNSIPRGTFDPLVYPSQEIEAVKDRIRNLPPVTAAQRHEVDLLSCKLDLRAARIDNEPSLVAAQTCLQRYLEQTRPAALRSEARGWLARTYFLRNNQAEAARIYLDELESAESNIKRERLLKSLAMLYRWQPPRTEELTALLDTPSHALYAANLVTNASKNSGADVLNKALMAELEMHGELFGQGVKSDELVLAQMRASLRLGDPDAILRFANRIPTSSGLRKDSEYLWLTGSAHYLKGSYRDAERVFVGVLDSDEVAASERAKAGLALEGVYEKTRRPVNQLWAAFRVLDLSNKVGVEFQDGGRDLSQVEGYGVNLDIAFLLDAQLTDTELKQYLDRYGNSPDFQFSTAGEMVQYAQAVRHARKEQFEEAAQIYSFLGFAVRADRANEAARLFAATRRPATEEARLQALYDYADFLVSNPNEIFFNDRLWSGYQRFAFTSRDDYSFPKPPADQLPRVRQFERKLQDEQEEYWRAYQILNGIVLKAGPTPLGKQAARRAVVALRRINTRFGRTPQIQAADRRLSSWLLRNESSSQSNTPAGPR